MPWLGLLLSSASCSWRGDDRGVAQSDARRSRALGLAASLFCGAARSWHAVPAESFPAGYSLHATPHIPGARRAIQLPLTRTLTRAPSIARDLVLSLHRPIPLWPCARERSAGPSWVEIQDGSFRSRETSLSCHCRIFTFRLLPVGQTRICSARSLGHRSPSRWQDQLLGPDGYLSGALGAVERAAPRRRAARSSDRSGRSPRGPEARDGLR